MEFININDISFSIHQDDLISNIIKSTNDFYEIEIFRAFKSLIPTSGVFLDIGANIGNHSLMFAVNFTGIEIYSFEPSIVNFPLLHRNLQSFSNVYPLNVAIGSKCGIVSLSENDPLNKGGISISKSGQKVPIMNLDSFDLQNVSFMKIDVEGHEYSVLEGAIKLIKNNKPVIWIEDYNGHSVSYLKELNYEIALEGPYYNFLLIPKY